MTEADLDPGDPKGIATVGTVLRAVNAYGLKGVRKVADTTCTGTDVAIADPELTITLPAGNYELRAVLIWDSAVAAGLKYAWSLPAGSSLVWSPSTANTTAAVSGAAQTAPGAGTRVLQATVAQGLLTVPLGGVLTLLWAQAVADATVTTMRIGSVFLAARFT